MGLNISHFIISLSGLSSSRTSVSLCFCLHQHTLLELVLCATTYLYCLQFCKKTNILSKDIAEIHVPKFCVKNFMMLPWFIIRGVEFCHCLLVWGLFIKWCYVIWPNGVFCLFLPELSDADYLVNTLGFLSTLPKASYEFLCNSTLNLWGRDDNYKSCIFSLYIPPRIKWQHMLIHQLLLLYF